MIQIKTAKIYTVSDGRTFESLEAAQRAELQCILGSVENTGAAIENLLRDKNKVVDVLTMGPRARPSRRKVNGFTLAKARKARESQKTEVQ